MDEPFDFDEASGTKPKKSKPKFKWWWLPIGAGGLYGAYYVYEKVKSGEGSAATTSDAAPADTGDDAGQGTSGGAANPPPTPTPTAITPNPGAFIAGAVAAITAADPKISAEQANNVINDILNGEPVPAGDQDIATQFADYLNSGGGYAALQADGLTIGNITVAASKSGTNTTTGNSSQVGRNTSVTSGSGAVHSAGKSLVTETGGGSPVVAAKTTAEHLKTVAKKVATAVGIAPQDKSAAALQLAVDKQEYDLGKGKLSTKLTPGRVGNVLLPVKGVNAGADILKPATKSKSHVSSAAKATTTQDFTAISDANFNKEAPKVVAPKKAAAPKVVAKKK